MASASADPVQNEASGGRNRQQRTVRSEQCHRARARPPQPRRRCVSGEPSPGADVAGASPVPAQSKPGPDVAVSYVQRLLDATQPLAALMMAGTVGLILRCSHRRGGPCSSLGPVRCGCPRVLLSSEDRALAERICHHPGCARPSISRLPLVAALAPLRCRPAERRQWLDHSRCAWSVRKVYVEVRRSLRCL